MLNKYKCIIIMEGEFLQNYHIYNMCIKSIFYFCETK